MDMYLQNRLDSNAAKFKRSVDRIADKYSKLLDEDDVPEVEIDKIKPGTLSKYIKKSKDRLLKWGLESQSRLTDLSLSSSFSAHSQSNLPCKDDGVDDGASGSEFGKDDSAGGTLRSLDESWRNPSESEVLPEDQDDDLHMSLSSQSTSLAEIYPSMVSRIGRAWHRQMVSATANTLVRRYRRWRGQPGRSVMDITAGSGGNPQKLQKSRRMLAKTTPGPASSTLASMRNGQSSPGRDRGLPAAETPPLISTTDFSDAAKPKEISFNKTFVVSELSPRKQSHLREQIPTSPSQRPYAIPQSSVHPSFSLRRLSGSPSVEVSTYTAGSPSAPERPTIYSSPVKQSPFKARTMSPLSRSPLAFARSSREHDGDWSREPMRPRSLSASMSSPSKRPVVLLRMPYPHDSNQSPPPRPLSPLMARPSNRHHRFARSLSFNSSLPRFAPNSPKEVDKDFVKLYHKFVCQNKSTTFNTLPCRLCGRSSEARGDLSSTSLAALALSPQRSILRKRHREQRCNSHPQSKRIREETYAHSPGSKRHRNEMLRHCLSQSKMELPPSASKLRTLQSAAHLEAWLDRHQEHFSALGRRFMDETSEGFSPRKWS